MARIDGQPYCIERYFDNDRSVKQDTPVGVRIPLVANSLGKCHKLGGGPCEYTHLGDSTCPIATGKQKVTEYTG